MTLPSFPDLTCACTAKKRPKRLGTSCKGRARGAREIAAGLRRHLTRERDELLSHWETATAAAIGKGKSVRVLRLIKKNEETGKEKNTQERRKS